jgi:diaminopimelate decarboxylase
MRGVWIGCRVRGTVGEVVLTSAPAQSGLSRVDGALWFDEVPLEALAAHTGTPAYVYSARVIREQYGRLSGALGGVPHRLHYSVKANSNLAVLRLLRELGAGVDIVSGGELFRALAAGFTGRDIVFSGVGKTAQELGEALDAGVLVVNVESEPELRLLDTVARERNRVAPTAFRVNPEVTVETPHAYTRTGERGMKFGIPHDEVLELARSARALKGVELIGLDMHVGSQIAQFAPYEMGIQRLLELREQIDALGGPPLRYLDAGGGLAVTYDTERPIDVEHFAARMTALIAPTQLELILEPGRFIVGNAGVLITRVLYRKRSGGREYVITDAGMNDLLRPSHYQAYHRIEAVRPIRDRVVANVVGPVCESGDFLALDRDIENVSEGELLAVHSAGAYGFVMASNYNSRPRAAEVLVDGDHFAVVTERERYEDIVRQERLVPEWRTVA